MAVPVRNKYYWPFHLMLRSDGVSLNDSHKDLKIRFVRRHCKRPQVNWFNGCKDMLNRSQSFRYFLATSSALSAPKTATTSFWECFSYLTRVMSLGTMYIWRQCTMTALQRHLSSDVTWRHIACNARLTSIQWYHWSIALDVRLRLSVV